jgi:DNA-binding NarL/FixJ family response regulator
MNNTQLNAKAVQAKQNEAVLWEIKAHYMTQIEKLAADNWHKMNSETQFIDDCNRAIEYAVRSYMLGKGDFNKRVQALFSQSLREYCGRRGGKRKGLDSYDQLSAGNEDNESTNALQLEDASVNVADEVIENYAANELIEKLADGCEKKRFVLVELAEGLNVSEIARKLSEHNDSLFNTERTFVKRYIKKLQEGGVPVV